MRQEIIVSKTRENRQRTRQFVLTNILTSGTP